MSIEFVIVLIKRMSSKIVVLCIYFRFSECVSVCVNVYLFVCIWDEHLILYGDSDIG